MILKKEKGERMLHWLSIKVTKAVTENWPLKRRTLSCLLCVNILQDNQVSLADEKSYTLLKNPSEKCEGLTE